MITKYVYDRRQYAGIHFVFLQVMLALNFRPKTGQRLHLVSADSTMEDVSDISYYIGSQAADTVGNLDVALSNGQIVSINLAEELPEDPNELISFLTEENCDSKYWVAVARAYSSSGKLDDAAEVLTQGSKQNNFSDADKLSLESSFKWLHLKYVSQGVDRAKHLSAANELIEKHLAATPSDVNNLLAKAAYYNLEDMVDQAWEIYDGIWKADSKNCFALLGKAHIALSKIKNFKSALKLYQQVLLLNPIMKPDPRIGIGISAWMLNDQSMALNSWNRALEIDPQNIAAKLLLNLSMFNDAFNNSLSDENFVTSYKECLLKLKELPRLSDDTTILLAFVSYFFSKEQYDVVEKVCNNIIFKYAGTSKVLSSKLTSYQSKALSTANSWLGRVAFAKNDYTQSQRSFHEAIRLDDNNLIAKLGLGLSQANRASNEEAIITFESVLKTNPKCLEVNYSLGLLYSKLKSRKKQDLAILILERYLRLSNNLGASATSNKNEDTDLRFAKKEPVVLNALLTLSRLYETRDLNQSLNYLNKAIESRTQIGLDVPSEVYNNLGVMNFFKNNTEEAKKNFEIASKNINNSAKSNDDPLFADLSLTIDYNLARSQELSDEKAAVSIYKNIHERSPNYFSAALRLLFLDCVSTNDSTKEEIKQQIEELLEENPSNLEIRSFYGWFAKTFGKKTGLKQDADTEHQKKTLVEYDSHDAYALLSLANIYCIMARDVKGSGSSVAEKKKKYYIRAIELFTKVISVDSKNVYAAQGLAIVYIENNDAQKGLEILRKIRDSLNDISVYLNLGHVLLELKQYSKAIENYEIALVRFTSGTDSKILSFLGRAWYLRGLADKDLFYLKKALDYAKEAQKQSSGSQASLRFNIAYVQFQIAEFVTKIKVEQRNVEDIKSAIEDLDSAIETLNALGSEDEAHPPYPKLELKSRANLGSTTLANILKTCLEETNDYINKVENRLAEAKKLRQEETAKKLEEEQSRIKKQKEAEEELAKERAKLQEQAQQWVEESRAFVEEDKDDQLFEEDASKSKENGKKKPAKKGKKGKKAKKKDFIDDSDEEQAPPTPSASEDEAPASSKRQAEDDEDVAPANKRKALSKDIIEDSDDELDDDLFNANEEVA